GVDAFAPGNGRLQVARAAAGSLAGATVIDDTYNGNPDSRRAASDVLAAQSAPRVLVSGEMGEVGDEGPAFHREIGAYAPISRWNAGPSSPTSPISPLTSTRGADCAASTSLAARLESGFPL
ncbi:hypothetical protein CF645_38485, partial [Burkholderia pseudomallei]